MTLSAPPALPIRTYMLVVAWALVGALPAQAQIPYSDQPISNLQNGISPEVAAVRRQQNERIAAAAQLSKSADNQAIAIRARLAEHDCAGARSLAAQSQDLSLSTQVQTLCTPPVLGVPAAPQVVGPQ